MGMPAPRHALLAVTLPLGLACAGLAPSPDAPSSGSGDDALLAATPGTCLRYVDDVPTVVSCDTPHDDEVFARFGLPSDLEAASETAEHACTGEAFTAYVGEPYEASRLSVGWSVGPTQITCLLFDTAPRTASAQAL